MPGHAKYRVNCWVCGTSLQTYVSEMSISSYLYWSRSLFHYGQYWVSTLKSKNLWEPFAGHAREADQCILPVKVGYVTLGHSPQPLPLGKCHCTRLLKSGGSLKHIFSTQVGCPTTKYLWWRASVMEGINVHLLLLITLTCVSGKDLFSSWSSSVRWIIQNYRIWLM